MGLLGGITLGVSALLVALVGVALFNPDLVYDLVKPLPAKEKVFPYEDKSYVVEGRSSKDEKVHDFKVTVSDEDLDDLNRRLNRTKFIPNSVVGAKFTYGFDPDILQEVVDYWLNKYDWKTQERAINQHAHKRTKIEGLNIHYLHAKPTDVPKDAVVHTLVLLHGWPGSFYEFWHMLPTLLKPRKLANGKTVALELVIPSMPGYVFSDAPQVPGLAMADKSRIVAKLMKRIGVAKYFLHGIDWGAIVGRNLAVMYPERVLGLSVALYPVPFNAPFFVKSALAMVFPFMVTRSERRKNIFNHLGYQVDDTGFAHIHATKPHTIGAALSDSPAGLAAWIMDKQASQSRPYENTYKEDGGLSQLFDMDTLLTNIMLYWITNSVGSSMRVYKENCGYFGCDDNSEYQYRFEVTVPAVFSDFRDEAPGVQPPDEWAKRYWKKVITVRKHKGGHFSALEKPKVLAEDVWVLIESVAKDLPASKSGQATSGKSSP